MHIGLENLQHFPAFGSPPHNNSFLMQPDFSFAPPSPLSTSPSSGKSVSFLCSVLFRAIHVTSGCLWPMFQQYCELNIPFVVLDGMRFPSLNGQSSSPVVGSLEDDSNCMSFAQVCIENIQIPSWQHHLFRLHLSYRGNASHI